MSEEVTVFGVVPASAKPDLPDGVGLIAHRDVAALVGDVDPEGVRAVRLLREHWRVLEEVAASTTVLPVRFGTAMADADAVVREYLEPSHDELAASLAEMDGKVQLTVKGSYDEAALMAGIVAHSPAVARLREEISGLPEAATYYKRIELGRLVAAEVEQTRDAEAAGIMERLGPLALAAKLEPASQAESAVNAAFLVPRDGIDAFSDAVAALERDLEGRVQLRYLGPLPPYSFTGEQAVGAWA